MVASQYDCLLDGPSEAQLGKHARHCCVTTFTNAPHEDPSTRAGELRFQRFMGFKENGFVLSTEFSGRQGPEHTVKGIEITLEEDFAVPSGWVKFWRASEPMPVLNAVMQSDDNPLRPEHLYDKVEEIHRSDADLAWELEAKQATQERGEFNMKVERRLKEQRKQIYKRGQVSSRCVLHPGKTCPVRWEDTRDRSVAAPEGGNDFHETRYIDRTSGR